jgi:hypothetical protein
MFADLGDSGFSSASLPAIEWLIKRGIIRREAAGRWEAIRELRNEGTHADFAHIATPLDAVQSLEILRDEIDALFVSETLME